MSATTEIVRGELERLFSLDEMTSMSRKLLGLDPNDVGGTGAKGSFAKALTERCLDADKIDALVDVILVSRQGVDPRLHDVSSLLGADDVAVGDKVGPFTLERKLGESYLSRVFLADLEGEPFVVKLLKRDAYRDKRALHRFLTANRMVANVAHPGLPEELMVGELENGRPFVSYRFVDATTLASRLVRTGPSHIQELKPILRGILEPLAALHSAQLCHGDLKLENVLVARGSDRDPSAFNVTLIDFGTDRLRARSSAANGHTGVLAVLGSPRTIAPELVRGRVSDPSSDVYAFGAMMYELLCGKPVFESDNATLAAFAHLNEEPEAPSGKAPRGWVPRDVDVFVLSLLAKEPSARPRDAQAVLDALEGLGRASMTMRAAGIYTAEKLEKLVDALIADPRDIEAALALEGAVEEGADAARVAEAFEMASAEASEGDDRVEAQKELLYRAARTLGHAAKDPEGAERIYVRIVELDPADDVALVALEEVRKQLGKFEEVVEMLLARSEVVGAGEARSRVYAEIGRICVVSLANPEQGLLAYTKALAELPGDERVASELERLAGSDAGRWTEVLATATEELSNETLSGTTRARLLLRIGGWYEVKLTRPDLALLAYQQVLAVDPANAEAMERLSGIYRRAQQWPELATLLMMRADAEGALPRARDLRTEAAEITDSRLNDAARAQGLLEAVLAEDPGHQKAGELLGRIAERRGDFQTLVAVLERRAEAKRGPERAEALARVAEVFEDRLEDLAEATRRFEAALALDSKNVTALKGLDRVYNRSGKYRELLQNLERQAELAATPRQKITLLERIGALYEEEFLDHTGAADAFEAILAIDATNDGALTALPRHYRALSQWDALDALYAQHIGVTRDEKRRIDLLVQRGRLIAEKIGSPERAMHCYEEVLVTEPGHEGALDALAKLREISGDASAAVTAIETLAANATTPEARAEQWLRAARVLEARGDKDGAIERYKRALEANPKDVACTTALRHAYLSRGDAASVIALLEKDLGFADGNLARARILAELARIYNDKVRDHVRAETAAKAAVELDATNADALMVLGELAFDQERWSEALKYLEPVVARASSLNPSAAENAVVCFMEAFARTPQARPSSPVSLRDVGAAGRGSSPAMLSPRLLAAVDAIELLPLVQPGSLARAARVVFDMGDAAVAIRLYDGLLARHGSVLPQADRAEALYRLGEALRRTGELARAHDVLEEAADADPSNRGPLDSLAKLFEAAEEWAELVKTKRRRLEVAMGAERFDLLMEIADVELEKLGDRTRAGKTYVAALEERPDDRKLLTKLMQLYSQEKDWARLVEVVLRLADFVDEPHQRAKYMHTAAIISARQLGEVTQALEFYEKAIVFDPGLAKAMDEAVELYRSRGDHDDVERLLKLQLDRAKASEDREKIVRLLDQLGELYRKFLNEPELAIDAYEAAQAFDPDGRERADALVELYASDVGKYLEKAVKAQSQIIRNNPYRAESYKLLRKLYTDARRADGAWCLCQVLSVLKLAEPDEERFYKRHRADNAAPAQASLEEDDWNTLVVSPETDPLVTKIFAMIQPTIVRARTQPLASLGYDSRHVIDIASHPYAVSQMLFYAHGVLGLPAPFVVQNPGDASGLGFLHSTTPAVLLGRAALESIVPNQQLAFVTGRHLTYFRPGFYVRHLVPTGTGLKAWLFAAIKLCIPQFPIAPDLAGQVTEAMEFMQADFQGVLRERLASLVSKLLQSGGAIDLKRWVTAIDLTADRAGMLLAHDLRVVTDVMRATEDASSVGSKDRIKEVVLFAVSEEYLTLRTKLGLAIE